MIEDFVLGIIIFLLAFYYATIFIHLLGIQIYKKADIRIGLALIPFYYWFKRDTLI